MAEIQQLLNDIETNHRVIIFHAIESGSRAWGFPSRDSDYDIRFIYHHSKSWYLSAFSKKDTIDLAIDEDLDASGWDVSKCMRLLHKGNAPLYEWLYSPMVYRQQTDKITKLQNLANNAFNPKVSYYHYMSLAKKKLLDEKTRHNTKSYLYALRALLCAKWIVDEESIPSVDVQPLINRYMCASDVNSEITKLISDKANQAEKGINSIPEVLLDFADNLYGDLRTKEPASSRLVEVERYDRVMQEIIDHATHE